MTLIVFDLTYSKFIDRCPTPCLRIATTPPEFIKKLQKFHPLYAANFNYPFKTF